MPSPKYWKSARAHKRAVNTDRAEILLNDAAAKGMRLFCLDGKHHWRVNDVVDWWPVSGVWVTVDQTEKGRGFSSLVKIVRRTEKQA